MAPAAIKDIEVNGTSLESRDGIVTSTEGNPVTFERKPYVQNEENDEVLKQAGVARAYQAATAQHPNGTSYNKENKNLTVLQQHLTFFDPDSDGIIWPLDTFRGFRQLGYNLLISIIAVLIIHLNFSYPTLPPGHYLPDPLCRIYIARIHKDKHGSDSGTYDTEGRFLPQKFEDIFSKYGSGPDKTELTFRDTVHYLNGQRVVFDPFGWGGALFEWGATWILLWPEDGKMKKDDIRGIFDGSLFYEIRKRRQENAIERR